MCDLTLRQAVPHVQPVVLAVALPHQQGVVLQVEGQEREGDVHVGRGDDHVGALQVVGVFIREARGLDHAGGAGEIAEAELRPCADAKDKRIFRNGISNRSYQEEIRARAIDQAEISHLTCRGCCRESFITDSELEYTVVAVPSHTNTHGL